METILLMLIGVAALVGGFVFVRMQSKSKGRWGIGLLAASCPRCGARLPMIRKPASMEEATWGGWTCTKCGCKVDKYGRERA